ncbi:MAG: low molecular weight protein-tyrosine-phosphatase [Planctomycetota bacterium]
MPGREGGVMAHEGDDGVVRVLFVCLGNICRSPMAEGVLAKMVADQGMSDRVVVDSAGTGHWHIGKRPDPRAIAAAAKHGVELPSRARQIDPAKDYGSPEDGGWDYIIALDEDHVRHIKRQGGPMERVKLLRSFDPKANGSLEVADPYYGDDAGFDRCYEEVEAGCEGLMGTIVDD